MSTTLSHPSAYKDLHLHLLDQRGALNRRLLFFAGMYISYSACQRHVECESSATEEMGT